jgi:HK97 family phage portal protein
MPLLKNLFSNNQPVVDREASPRPDYPSRSGTNTKANQVVSIYSAMSVATFYRGMNIITDDIAKMPFQQFVRSDGSIEQVAPDGATRNMAYLTQVSPNQWGWTPFQFFKAASTWVITHGNTYIWKPPVTPPQLLILPANRTVPVFDKNTGDLWYQHTFSNGEKKFIPAVEILHLMINPDESGVMGRGVLQFARESIGRQLGAYTTQSRMYSSGLTAAAYVHVDAHLDKEGRAKIKEAYSEAISGAENAYSLAVFDKKITQFAPIQINPKDAEFLAQIDATDRDICNFLGLSEHMLNRGKQAYNSNEQKYTEYLQGTLDAYLVPWEQGARIKWLSQDEQGRQYFKFNRASLLRMDAKVRAETNSILIQSGQLKPNEARALEERAPYADGDQFFMMSNVSPITGVPQNAQ